MEAIKATIMEVGAVRRSRHGGFYQYVFFKEWLTGKSYRTCLSPGMGNFARWDGLLKEGNVLDNLRVITRGGNEIIDADSIPQLINQ